ncbi:MAG: PRD domain-containing protein [Lachnospiraceae bacterium]
MKVIKVLNNNAAIVVDENGMESVVMGKGIAHKAKKGEEITGQEIDKIFILDDKSKLARYSKLFTEIPEPVFSLSNKYIEAAIQKLNRKLQNSLYISLADHLNSMIERGRVHAYIKNKMLWDIKRMYQDEFQISRELVKEFNQLYGTVYDDNEAATISLHFVNATIESDYDTTVKITKLIGDILSIVKYNFMIEYDEDSYSYYRFVVHLRFLAQRIFQDTMLDDPDMSQVLRQQLTGPYEEAFGCADKVKQFVVDHYSYLFTEQECLFLAIYIIKVVSDSNKIRPEEVDL